MYFNHIVNKIHYTWITYNQQLSSHNNKNMCINQGKSMDHDNEQVVAFIYKKKLMFLYYLI